MKKFTIIGLAICLAFALAAPVMATDVDFSGSYYVRGFYTSHWDLDETSASNAYMDMRFRLKTVFKVSDILSVTARFDALDGKTWGETDTARTGGNANNVNFDRAYMTIKAPIGTFYVGRMPASTWGTDYLDAGTQRDRIKYKKVIDNLTLWAVFQKNEENDDATGTAGVANDDAADQDSENYYLLGKYKMENTTAGLLLCFSNDKQSTVSEAVGNETTHKYTAMPYFVAKFGPLDIQGELAYNWGQTERDPTAAGVAQADIDIKELAYNLEATYSFGPASVMAGYAFVSGDNDALADNEDSAYAGVGADWEKLFILTYDEAPVNALGPLGANLTATGNYGAKIIYGGANFSPLDNLELGIVVGKADADELGVGESKDDYGVEYDFTLNWEIYDNLTYNAVVAFLKAGDFYKEQSVGGLASTTFDDTYAIFHQLELAF